MARETAAEKPGTNPFGARVTRLWDDLVAGADKVAETPAGTLYKLRSAVASRPAGGAA